MAPAWPSGTGMRTPAMLLALPVRLSVSLPSLSRSATLPAAGMRPAAGTRSLPACRARQREHTFRLRRCPSRSVTGERKQVGRSRSSTSRTGARPAHQGRGQPGTFSADSPEGRIACGRLSGGRAPSCVFPSPLLPCPCRWPELSVPWLPPGRGVMAGHACLLRQPRPDSGKGHAGPLALRSGAACGATGGSSRSSARIPVPRQPYRCGEARWLLPQSGAKAAPLRRGWPN